MAPGAPGESTSLKVVFVLRAEQQVEALHKLDPTTVMADLELLFRVVVPKDLALFMPHVRANRQTQQRCGGRSGPEQILRSCASDAAMP